MKRFAVVGLAVVLILLAGCNAEPLEWKVSSDLGNGLFALVPEQDPEAHEWYSVVDRQSGELLSLGLKYPAEYGTPTTTECKVGGKTAQCNVTSGERDSGGVLFYTLSAENFDLDSTKKIKITQKFQNETVEIEFTPERIKAAFDKEY